MQNEPIPRSSLTPAEQDSITQGAILAHLLSIFPAQLTAAELLREMSTAPEDVAERDSIERATRDLACAGLLHRNGDFVFPTRAAMHHAALPMS